MTQAVMLLGDYRGGIRHPHEVGANSKWGLE